ncbi:hypothetical protein PHLCEN_2v11457 [Hermanssonia centrifuga]|uniref:GH16 domain-containing protein n=1 Tax=Hermanssonia centrifuga TaxID=98765 RepID=A0A2R6NJZ9_9APHY|nr:hypothetical protein PHLCEN_2v11457 [Hermanssonia centrifuga]
MSTAWPSSPESSPEGTDTHSNSGKSSPEDNTLPPRTPTTSSVDSPLLAPDSPPAKPPTRSFSSSNNFISSPLNPHSSHAIRSRPGSRGSTHFNRVASEESQALTSHFTTLNPGQRGSMVLYRLADDDGLLLPPKTLHNRDSVASSSGDSIFSLSSDSKYPSGVMPGRSGFVPYAYDPDLDMKDEDEEEDPLHQIDADDRQTFVCSVRGFLNVGVLVLLIAAIITLFVCYPVLSFYRNNARNLAIDGNIRINATGQAPVLFQMPELIDPETPDAAKTRTGFDGQQYELVFSDEFNTEGRTFYPGDDPYWEAVDLWYGSTMDQEWYDPSQITTKNGHLSIVMEAVEDITLNHMLPYKSGMLQSWNKFCFTSGYVEVSITLPGPNSDTKGYWPGAWTMGNLGRPGYGATSDGTWPYSQQAISCLTDLPDNMFQGSGQVFTTLGFEYWANPGNPEEGFITWQSNGQPSYTLGANAVGPDTGDDGSMVGQRRIPEEPMSIVLNLAISSE